MQAEISFDLVMVDNMSFVEGCYRLSGGDWEVFIFIKSHGFHTIGVRKNVRCDSGVTGINFVVPDHVNLNKTIVMQALSDALDITEWRETLGPDSMQLR